MLNTTTSHRDSPSALKREVTYRPNSEKVIGSENIASKMSHNLFGTDADSLGVGPFFWQLVEVDQCCLRNYNSVIPQKSNNLLQRLKHVICASLPLLHLPQELHDLDQACVVALVHLSEHPQVCPLYETVQL